MKISFGLVALLALVALPSPSRGQIPRVLSYQGVLTDTVGNPKPDGVYPFTFRLYEVGSGGTAIWMEAKSIEIKRGLFATALGDVTPFDAGVRFDRPYWLSIQSGAEPELSPRIPLTAVGYSISSINSDTARFALAAPQQSFVDSARIAGTVPDQAITSPKIADSAVTMPKLHRAGATPGQVIKWTGTTWAPENDNSGGPPSGTAGGDLTGTYPDPTIANNAVTSAKILDATIATGDIANAAVTMPKINQSGATGGQVIKWTGAAWAPANDISGGLTLPYNDSVSNVGGATFRVTNLAANGISHGLVGTSGSPSGSGLYGEATAISGQSSGVRGESNSSEGQGVAGFAWAPNGTTLGMRGQSISPDGIGVGGFATAGNGINTGVWGESNSPDGTGTVGYATAPSGSAAGVEGASESSGGYGVYGLGASTSGTNYGVFGATRSSSGVGVAGEAEAFGGVTIGVRGETASDMGLGVAGFATAATGFNYGVYGRSSSLDGAGMFGYANATSGMNVGVQGETASSTGYGVFARANATSGFNYGVYGVSNSNNGTGVYGFASSTTFGANVGVRGESPSSTGYGMFANATAGSGFTYGLYAQSSSTDGVGVYGRATATTGSNYGIRGLTQSPDGSGIFGLGNALSGPSYGVRGQSNSSTGYAVYGLANAASGANYGVYGRTNSTDGSGVMGFAQASTGANYGVFGQSNSTTGSGVLGLATAGTAVGVFGQSNTGTGYGVYGTSPHIGVWARSTAAGDAHPALLAQRNAGDGSGIAVRAEGGINNGYGVYATGTTAVYGSGQYGVYGNGNFGVYGVSASNQAGYFSGSATVTGLLSKGGGSFKIDHPLDPANKYLYHSFVESPDMMNVYNGNVELDANGDATVKLPSWFEALNREFRYQLTAIGAPGPNIYIASEVQGNQFKIAGGRAGMKVSWQVTGIRKDAFAEKHRIRVEENKKSEERGYYMHPDAFGLSKEMAIPANRPLVPVGRPEVNATEVTAVDHGAAVDRVEREIPNEINPLQPPQVPQTRPEVPRSVERKGRRR